MLRQSRIKLHHTPHSYTVTFIPQLLRILSYIYMICVFRQPFTLVTCCSACPPSLFTGTSVVTLLIQSYCQLLAPLIPKITTLHGGRASIFLLLLQLFSSVQAAPCVLSCLGLQRVAPMAAAASLQRKHCSSSKTKHMLPHQNVQSSLGQ
jgi:hypothetical protein